MVIHKKGEGAGKQTSLGAAEKVTDVEKADNISFKEIGREIEKCGTPADNHVKDTHPLIQEEEYTHCGRKEDQCVDEVPVGRGGRPKMDTLDL